MPTYWGARIRASGVRLVRSPGDSTAGEQIVKRDGERASARQNRLGEARPTVPNALSWLMLAAVVMVLAVLSTASMPGVGRLVQVAIVLAAATAFVSTLLLILDLDHPYAGALRREPTQTEFVRDQIAAEVRGPLPCDPTGLPADAPASARRRRRWAESRLAHIHPKSATPDGVAKRPIRQGRSKGGTPKPPANGQPRSRTARTG